jgi:nicotinamidase-related amidase
MNYCRLAARLTWILSPGLALFAAAPQAPDPSFFKDCVFVSVDVQEPGPRHHVTADQLPKEWVGFGFTAQDVNAAIDYAYDVAYPNSRRVADGCRSLHLPMVFIHWGCLFQDGMDLDPVIRQSFLAQHGTDYAKWGHHVNDPGSRPATILGVRPGEYVLPKSGQDAFNSSNLGFLLTNLGAKNIVFIGGHTGACLGKTAASAKRLGYRILVVEDATFDARESGRLTCMQATGYHYTVTTDEFLRLVAAANANRGPAAAAPAAAAAATRP